MVRMWFDLSIEFNGLPLTAQLSSPGPILFEWGPIAVRWYGLLIAAAVICGVSLSSTLAQRRGFNPDLMSRLAMWLVIAAIPGARVYYVLFNWDYYARNPGAILAVWQGGLAIHGAILAGILAALLFARWHQVSFWQLADLVAPSLILGQAIGRWGNFFNSEAFGAPTDLPWRLYIPPTQRPPGFEAFDYFHPTFLYESLWNLGVFALLLWLFFRGGLFKSLLKPGTLFLVYWVAYSLGRFWIEGLRMDSLMLGPLRVAQVISLIGIAVGLSGLVWLYGWDRSLPEMGVTVTKESREPKPTDHSPQE